MFVIPIPIFASRTNLSILSFVILFLTSFITTSPIKPEEAKQVAESGSAVGLSLFVCGYRF